MDTDFDISICETFLKDVITHMGQSHVPDHIVSSIINIILRASTLYSTHLLHSDPDTLPHADDTAPLLTTPLLSKQNTETFDDFTRRQTLLSSASIPFISSVAKGESFILPQPHNSVDVSNLLAGNVIPVQREKFAKFCLISLLDLCSDELAGMYYNYYYYYYYYYYYSSNIFKYINIAHIIDIPEIRNRIAAIAAPFFLEKCTSILSSYATDRPRHGRFPFPR